jgi:hypothetical protein
MPLQILCGKAARVETVTSRDGVPLLVFIDKNGKRLIAMRAEAYFPDEESGDFHMVNLKSGELADEADSEAEEADDHDAIFGSIDGDGISLNSLKKKDCEDDMDIGHSDDNGDEYDHGQDEVETGSVNTAGSRPVEMSQISADIEQSATGQSSAVVRQSGDENIGGDVADKRVGDGVADEADWVVDTPQPGLVEFFSSLVQISVPDTLHQRLVEWHYQHHPQAFLSCYIMPTGCERPCVLSDMDLNSDQYAHHHIAPMPLRLDGTALGRVERFNSFKAKYRQRRSDSQLPLFMLLHTTGDQCYQVTNAFWNCDVSKVPTLATACVLYSVLIHTEKYPTMLQLVVYALVRVVLNIDITITSTDQKFIDNKMFESLSSINSSLQIANDTPSRNALSDIGSFLTAFATKVFPEDDSQSW